jgi:hypothetical protein
MIGESPALATPENDRWGLDLNISEIAGTIDAGPNRGLRALDELARTVGRMAWFSRVGMAPQPGCLIRIAAILSGLGAAGSAIQRAESWAQTQKLLDQHRRGGSIYVELESESARLRKAAAGLHGSGLVEAILADATETARDTAHGAAAGAALRDGVGGTDLVRHAAADAERATRMTGLALAAGESAHPFIHWLGVFEAGHWPIGIVGGAFRLF